MSILVKAKDLAKIIKEKRKKLGPDAGDEWVQENLQESFDKGEITVNDFSLRDMAENLIDRGHEMIGNWSREERRGGHVLMEAAHAVDTSAMANITGQLYFNAIKQAMDIDEHIGDQLFSVFPSNIRGKEIVPGIGGTEDEYADNVTEGEPYPLIGLAEEVIQIPATEKKGGILGITREAIIADKTGLITQRGNSLGIGLANRMEKSRLDVFIGRVNPYVYQGEARLTYGDGATAGQAMGFLNEALNNLVDYTDLQAVADLFYAMRDPTTGEPMGHAPTTIVCCKSRAWTVRHVIRDVQIRFGNIAAAPGIQSIGGNRIPWDLEVLDNEWVMQRILLANGGPGGITAANRAAADLHWWIGKPKACFVWKELWPLTVVQAPSNNEAEFTQDVVFRVKASYSGVAGVLEPRLMIRVDGTG